MTQTKIYPSIIAAFVCFICFLLPVFSWYLVFIDFNLIYLLFSIFITLTQIPYLIYYYNNFSIDIKDNFIFVPNPSFVKSSRFQIFETMFDKKISIDIFKIKSVDFEVVKLKTLLPSIYNSSIFVPIRFIMLDGSEFSFITNSFSRRKIKLLLEYLNQINSKIEFSNYCRELIDLKSNFSFTPSDITEMKESRKTGLFMWVVSLICILFLSFLFYEDYNMNTMNVIDVNISSAYGEYKDGLTAVSLETSNGTFDIGPYVPREPEIANFVSALKENDELFYNVKIFELQSPHKIYSRVSKVTLSDNRTFHFYK